MRRSYFALAGLGSILATACARAPAPPPSAPVPAPPAAPAAPAPAAPAAGAPAAPAAADELSYAEPAHVRVRRLRLDLRADFAARELAGTATLELDWPAPNGRIVLDTRDLAIERVEVPAAAASTWRAIPFTLGPRDPILGSALSIPVDRPYPEVRIAYRTSPAASGLQWLPPAQTAGGAHPLLFTQSQAIHARSWVPLQDTPGVRFTYRAHIAAPPPLVALMSADNDPGAPRDGAYAFEMPQPIPSYLLALAIGDLAFRPLSPRAGVWAERPVVARAAAEFADTERMIRAIEALYGPYRWGRYDLLILPASFPFGGMENPRLSFITPTVITGDRALVSMIAHELAHSWSGNLVTGATWRDLWLNEGFTTYVENRVVEALYGREAAEVEAVLGQRELRARLARVPPAFQALHLPPLAGLDPDEVAGEVAYGKGQWFLLDLERRVGRAALDAFLRRWFEARAFQSVTTADFVAFLRADPIAAAPGAPAGAALDAWLAAWIERPGIPADAVPVASRRLAAIDAARAAWLGGAALAGLGAATWTTHERVCFLEGLPARLPPARLAALDAALALTGTANGELARAWYPLAIRAGYAPARTSRAIAAFLERIGRRRLVLPIYAALAATPDGLALAREVLARARARYHPLTTASVEALLARPR